MPKYTFKCPECEDAIIVRLSFSDYESVKCEDKLLLCEGHDIPMALIFNPGDVGFVLKDGESGGWPSKSAKENKFRKARNRVMAKREKDHVFKSRLVPNFGGMEAHSWKDVQDHARDKKGEASAKTYDSLVSSEVR